MSSSIRDLQTEKELQAGGEIKELQELVDKLQMKCGEGLLAGGEGWRGGVGLDWMVGVGV